LKQAIENKGDILSEKLGFLEDSRYTGSMETIYIVIEEQDEYYDGNRVLSKCVVSCHKTKAGAEAAIEVLKSNFNKKNKYSTTFYYETADLED
jgi:hypothetical protein